MGKLTYKKRTTKRNSNKRNITKRKLLKKGGDDTIEGEVSIEGQLPIEYTKKDIEQKIKEYITEKTNETDKTDPIHYLDKIIAFMDKPSIDDDEKIKYLKLLIRKFLENNEDIPNNMYNETKYTVAKSICEKNQCSFNAVYAKDGECDNCVKIMKNPNFNGFILSKELLCYILRTCLYYYSFSFKSKYDEKKDKKTIFLRTLVIDILRFFFTSQKVDFAKYKVVEVVGKLDIEDSKLDIEDSGFDMEKIFEKVKKKKIITRNFNNYKLKHYVNSILYSDSKKSLSDIIQGMPLAREHFKYSKFEYSVNEYTVKKTEKIEYIVKESYNIIDKNEFNNIINTCKDEYDEKLSSGVSSTKSNVELTSLFKEIGTGKGRYKGFNLF